MPEAATAQNPYTRQIAEFVSGLRYENIPAEVRERLKLLILDSLGCAIYGAHLEWCRILQAMLEQVDKTRETSIWGTDRRLSSPHAALVNGTQVQSFPGGLSRLRRTAVGPSAQEHVPVIAADP